MDGMCLEMWGGDILSVKKAEMSIPLQRMADVLEWPSEAFLAKWSAFSLPVTLLWLEIHLMVRLQFE